MAKPAAEEAEEEAEEEIEVAAAVPQMAASTAEQETEAAAGAERPAEIASSTAAMSTAAAAPPAAEVAGEKEEDALKEEVTAAEPEAAPIPKDCMNELEARAMWADAEEVEKQFPASRWPGLDGVFWRLAHKIKCDERIISCNTKAIPAGQIIVGSIFIHVTTPQVSAHTRTRTRTRTRMARPEMCASALVGRLRRRG